MTTAVIVLADGLATFFLNMNIRVPDEGFGCCVTLRLAFVACR